MARSFHYIKRYSICSKIAIGIWVRHHNHNCNTLFSLLGKRPHKAPSTDRHDIKSAKVTK